MTTRLLHISDTHLGNRQYGSDIRRKDFADAFEQAIEYAIEQDVEAVIHTGDLFETRDPRLPDLNQCIDILQQLDTAEIPFYGIVGNHERKMDDQYLDLISKTGVAERLDTTPTIINDEVAIYGIDAVTRPAWHAEDFTLDSPTGDVFTVLCMHQLLQPPVPGIQADHPLDDVLDRVNIDLDALALGDYHESVGTAEREIKIWYAGSTERCAVDEKEARSVSLLEIEDGELTRWQKELDTRDFETITINFAKNDGYGHAEDEIDRYVVENKFVFVTVVGKSNTVTSSDVRGIVMDRGAAVCRVEDERGGPEIDTSDTPNGDVQNKDKRIEEKLAEKDISGIVAQIDERVRTEGVSPSGFDNEVEEMVMQAQAEAFDETAESTTTEMADK